jgi:hypothetical protein
MNTNEIAGTTVSSMLFLLMMKMMTNDLPHAVGLIAPKAIPITGINVDTITDSLGRSIDPGIKRAVVLFNSAGLVTSGSCEGHIENAVPNPYVDFDFNSQSEYVSLLLKFTKLKLEFSRANSINPAYSINLWTIGGHGSNGFIRVTTLPEDQYEQLTEDFKKTGFHTPYGMTPAAYKSKALETIDKFAAFCLAKKI